MKINGVEIEVTKDDITTLWIDAIVNAANESLLGGGGVDGAIHKAAGPELLEECKTLNGARTGEAKITNGYKLPASFVIHTVGPKWEGGENNEANDLTRAYKNSMKLANEQRLRSIAFPNISTGVYGFPKDKAAEIAISAMKDFIKSENKTLDKIIFCCFDDENLELYKEILKI